MRHFRRGELAQFSVNERENPVGDRRVAYPWIGCGQCSLCRAGNEHLCNASQALGVNRDGGFADHVLVPHPRYLLAHDGLAEEQACTYACAGLTAYSALKKAAPLSATGDALVIEDERLQSRVNQLVDRLEASLRQSTRLAVTAGQLPQDWDVNAYANTLIAYVIGRWHLFAKSGFKRSPTEGWPQHWRVFSA